MSLLTLSPWAGFEPGHIGFCEARLDGWIVEPANAWSSLAYVAVGGYLASRAMRGGRSPLLLVGVTAVLVGLGSFAFHATGTFLGEFADESSMFLIGSLMVTLALRRTYGWDFARCARTFALVAASSSLLLARFHGTGLVTFALQIGLTAVLEIALWRGSAERANYLGLKLTLACFGVAYGVWWLDFGKLVCDPNNHVLGGHAVWHTLSAASLASYQYFQEQFLGAASPAPLPVAVPPTRDPEPEPIPSLVESLRSIHVMRAAMLTAPDSSSLGR